MAQANFIPSILANMIFEENRKKLVFANLCNSEIASSSRILQEGDRVKVSQFASPTVSTYTRGQEITWNQVDDASIELVIDHLKIAPVRFDQVDLKQMAVDPTAALASELSYQMAQELDAYIAGLYAQAGVISGLGTTASSISLTSDNIQQYMNLVNQRLTESNAPQEDRWMVVFPAMATLISDLVLTKATMQPNTDVITKGYVTSAFGFDIYVSNNVQTASSKYKVLAGTRRAISLVEQINSIQEVDLMPKYVGKGIVALHVAGAKVIRPSDLACLTCTA